MADLLVPPHAGLFSPVQFAQLATPLAGIILATTNYSAVKGEAGPTAPLAWVRDALAALQPEQSSLPKLIATLPFGGWDFRLPSGPATSIDGNDYTEILERHRPPRLDWHADAAEHQFSYMRGDWRHSVYYPTLKGLAERLGVVRQMGVGLAISDIGSGLDYFWDLL